MFPNVLATICFASMQSRLTLLKLIYYRLLVFVTLFGLIFYICWNVIYVTHGKIPTSIIYKLTEIPSPTTGMFRSFNGIIKMRSDAYISNNPFVIPFLILIFYTGAVLATKYKNKQPLIIKNSLGVGYLVIMIISEIWMLLT